MLITNNYAVVLVIFVLNSRNDDEKRRARPNELFGPSESQLPRGSIFIVNIYIPISL